ncbi:maturin isoform X2 [Taeniopygia guttata]|uniref:maturin isoform X2 n=1 Tax=Taeniopygia guttata TaxID=59729 RepID=UPI0011AFA5CE
MAFEALAEAAERWCARTPFQLIAAEETERRMDFYAEPGVSFYVLCPEAACGDNFHVWSESEDCLPFLQLAQDYISSCGKKTLHEILEKVFKSFRPHVKLSVSVCQLQARMPASKIRAA